MAHISAGILVYKSTSDGVRVLLVHPAGPIWSKRDTWGIPKGWVNPGETNIEAAYREFEEEVGIALDRNLLLTELGASAKQNDGITNYIWALETDVDIRLFKCNNFTMEWPPKSGKMQEFPENDRAEWFSLGAARGKLYKVQKVFIDRLAEHLGAVIDDSDAQPQQSLL